jgi:D-alanyl-lipoteichoic acid acyltransferase DltB (MBOAT superfamily)
MRFNSLGYLVFLAVAVALYWATPARVRKYVLLATSFAFYGLWHWPYLVLLVGSALLNHLGAKWIASTQERKRRVAVVVGANLLLLGAYKYAAWLLGLADDALDVLGLGRVLPVPHWMLPLGISFFLFEGMSYVIDVGRKREKPHPTFSLLLFIAFFPKLIAGPIMRAKELLPQIERDVRAPEGNDVLVAIRQIAFGLFLKVVVADGIAQSVDAAFSRNAAALSFTDAWLMAIAFGMQIYFDFSSYSRIAIGSARLFGIELVENFDHPYVANSPSSFWNRWHMSLSRWIRDYVFFPLVGKKATLASMCRAAVLSMTLCGLWHGAAFTFVLWGAWHGLLIAGNHVAEHLWPSLKQPSRTHGAAVVRVIVTFLFVSLGWIFFRAAGVVDATRIFARALSPWRVGHVLPGTMYLFVFLLVAAVFAAPRATRGMIALRARPSGWLVDGAALGLAFAAFLVYLRGQSAFIYFQF